MRRTTWLTLILALAGVAYASSCPLLMQDIDAALEDPAVVDSLSEEQLAEARQLREEGEEAHRTGDHARSVDKLEQAKSVLGIS